MDIRAVFQSTTTNSSSSRMQSYKYNYSTLYPPYIMFICRSSNSDHITSTINDAFSPQIAHHEKYN